MISFGITRPFQLLWVGAVVFGQWNDEYTIKWQALMQLAVTCILTYLQIMTLKIHYGIWKRCIANKKKMALDRTSTMIDLESPGGCQEGDNSSSRIFDEHPVVVVGQKRMQTNE